jgi:hypothetical protein
MRLLPPEVLPAAERRAWSRRHPVRASFGYTLLLTPCFAAVVLLAPDLSWGVRLGELLLAAVVTFLATWSAIRFRWADRLRT